MFNATETGLFLLHGFFCGCGRMLTDKIFIPGEEFSAICARFSSIRGLYFPFKKGNQLCPDLIA
jgi:hypothetical protein